MGLPSQWLGSLPKKGSHYLHCFPIYLPILLMKVKVESEKGGPAVMNESTYWHILAYFKIFTILTVGKWHLVWLWFAFLSIWVSWNIFLMVKGHLYIDFLVSCLFMVFSPCFRKAFSNLVLMLPFLYLLSIFTFRRRQWHPTPVLSPGKSHGWRSLVGCSPWGL